MKSRHMHSWLLMVIAMYVVGSTGCNLLPHIAYVAGGTMTPPQFDGLEKARVAVVCVSDGSSYGSGNESGRLARGVTKNLQENVPDIEVVPAAEIADWIDRKGWDEIDYREVGRGVKAERVVAIDLSAFRVREGSSLFKGRADLIVTVFDMTTGGKEVFRKEIDDFSFPSSGFYHATETSESKFTNYYLKVLAGEVAKPFHEYDMIEEYGRPSHIGG